MLSDTGPASPAFTPDLSGGSRGTPDVRCGRREWQPKLPIEFDRELIWGTRRSGREAAEPYEEPTVFGDWAPIAPSRLRQLTEDEQRALASLEE